MSSHRGGGELTVAFAAYTAATVGHYAHNAALLALYPNLPPWLTRSQIILAGGALALFGLVGYWLATTRYRRAGYVLLACYAAFGFDGLGHYSVAPMSAHSFAMNTTIWAESIAAALLGAGVLRASLRTRLERVSEQGHR